LRRIERNVFATARRLERMEQVLQAGEEFVRRAGFDDRRQLRELRPLPRICGWLCEAADRLHRVARDLQETTALLREAPELPGDAPGALLQATDDFLEQSRQLVLLWSRLDGLLARFGVARAVGGVFAGIVPATETRIVRRGRDRAPAIPVSHPRHRRSHGNAASAARRICRGRAPPALLRTP